MMHPREVSTTRIMTTVSDRISSAPRRGYSLLEIVIVIAIIAALLALALPALRGVQHRSRKMQELNNLRQVGMAWFLYAQSNNDHALPGYLEPEVQEVWDVSYEYPEMLIQGDPLNRDIPPDIAAPWTWRLLPYLNNTGQLLRSHLGEDDFEALELLDNAEKIALEPGFGYNGYYIGGYWEMTSGDRPRPSYRFAKATNQEGHRVNVVARSPASISASNKIIVFCSATLREPGIYSRARGDEPGTYFARPPFLADIACWSSNNKGEFRSDDPDNVVRGNMDAYTVEVLQAGSIPIGRYTGAAAVFYADGHTDTQTPGALADQSLWSIGAEKVGEVPSSRFTHSNQ